jgi:hypothetical protein
VTGVEKRGVKTPIEIQKQAVDLDEKTFGVDAVHVDTALNTSGDELTMAEPVGSFTLLKEGLKRIFDEGLLLSSYNIYSQFMPWQMETFILELVAACSAVLLHWPTRCWAPQVSSLRLMPEGDCGARLFFGGGSP